MVSIGVQVHVAVCFSTCALMASLTKNKCIVYHHGNLYAHLHTTKCVRLEHLYLQPHPCSRSSVSAKRYINGV